MCASSCRPSRHPGIHRLRRCYWSVHLASTGVVEKMLRSSEANWFVFLKLLLIPLPITLLTFEEEYGVQVRFDNRSHPRRGGVLAYRAHGWSTPHFRFLSPSGSVAPSPGAAHPRMGNRCSCRNAACSLQTS